MGQGKTLFTTLFALIFSQNNPNSKIYANYHLDLPNFIFTPFMFLEYSKLDNCLIICDDFYALQNLKSFIMIIVNLSRKVNLTILLSAQYYTMIPKQIRMISDFEVRCEYFKEIDYLRITRIDGDNNNFKNDFLYAVNIAKDLYDTNEVVVFPTESNMIKELVKYSKNKSDLELNLTLYSRNASTRRKLFKQICNDYNIND